MNRKQERKLSMFVVLAQFIQGTLSAILAAMPNFDNLFGEFMHKVNEINVLTGNQVLNREGNFIEKITIKELVSKQGGVIAGKVMGYASNNDLYLLYSEVDYTESGLVKLPDTLCRTTCMIIHDKALEHLANLAPYGVTAEMLGEFKANVELYELSIPKPKAGIQDKKAATAGLKVKFQEASVLVAKMFKLTRIVTTEYPEFVEEFINAKRIDKAAYYELSAKGMVVDGEGNRVGKVTMVCNELNFKRRVSASGGFYLKHMEDGVYQFVFSRPGYETTVVKMVFYKGERFDVEVVMKVA
ncbi:carboxypeptidase-like regulatory domain-containing protein [Flavobacterium capsici]|uniref:Carboxypeptidase-like regulatory domain-containing protein n=1 Tax=Flavobacterium capsici TaxID=3075618 RepID=A0AA96F1W2_9FLAO|nr:MULTISPECIES: carboxypeptidase-like regulatory domain-containing protein [unclassified Flavobacterium]WNM18563.1 carboxypeptidase-like regulatory domain-containing protein [Flavobacterium sp. PMR2A8]WNM22614.1 carboxypeptidase-like regulatory domain-containing protein [Flavobacterium sp. PMTSA4]